MSCIIFNGKAYAENKEHVLAQKVQELKRLGVNLHVKTFTFHEDEGSRLYTKLKMAAANRVGISYEPEEFSLTEDLGLIVQTIREASVDADLSGIMIQKPSKLVWEQEISSRRRQVNEFSTWWEQLTNAIDPTKDVDCLTQANLNKISPTNVLPATAKACLSILEEARMQMEVSSEEWKQKNVVVVGRSDIVGKPLTQLLRRLGHNVNNIGRQEFGKNILNTSDILISAVGVKDLITGSMVKEGAIVIDVGSPAGDIERTSVEPKAVFLTPVPGGVGPVTVISLMENIVLLAQK
ncbi:MAG: bifunctional 5,10-methylenetetrahydrofolate dehydrogenase/5,10-methenyltetrahydrofolate cyclohydrolase [Candidatus Woesebacteria bacterium]